MKSTGIVRPVDNLGRVVLPIELRHNLHIDKNASLEIYVDGEKYDVEQGELGVPTFMNVADTIVYDYIQTQSAMIFDFD